MPPIRLLKKRPITPKSTRIRVLLGVMGEKLSREAGEAGYFDCRLLRRARRSARRRFRRSESLGFS